MSRQVEAVNCPLVPINLWQSTRAYQLVAVNCQPKRLSTLNSSTLISCHSLRGYQLSTRQLSAHESCLSTHQLSTCACQLVVLYYQLSTLNSSTIGYHFVLINSSTVNLSMSACGSLLSARQLSTRQLMGRVNLRFCGRTVRVTCTNTCDLFKAGR